MDKEDLKKSICINLRCVTQSSKGGVPLNQLQNEYKQLLGTPIPFKDLGYSSLENFLWDIPDVICLKKYADGSLIVEGVADASTAHIAKLISKQKPSKKSKSCSTKPAVITRKWGNSSKTSSSQKIKTPFKDMNSIPPNTLNRRVESNVKFVRLTPDQQELKKSVLINLRSVVQSSKDGVPLNRLQRDYRKFIGSHIPFENLGYSTLHKFIQSIPDVINLKMDVNEQLIAIGVVDKATAHLFGNTVKPKSSKSVTPPNEPSVNKRATFQVSSEQEAESPSFFKLPENTLELSDLSSVLKHVPSQKKVRKTTQPVYSVSQLILKNKMKRASKEEPIMDAKPIANCKENFASEVSLSTNNIASFKKQNKIAETTVQNRIKVAGLNSLVWMCFILYGPSKIKTLRKNVLSFYGFPFSADSKQWKEKINLLSQLPEETLHQLLHMLCIEYDPNDSKKNLKDKLIDYLATYVEESGTNAQETEQKENEKDASTLTLSSVSSDVLSKCSYYADTETSDAVLSDKNFISFKTKNKIVSDSDSDFIEPPLGRQNVLQKSYHLKETKKLVQDELLNDKGCSYLTIHESIQSEKICSTKQCNGTKSVLSEQQPLHKNYKQKVDSEECTKTETSSVVSSKSAKRNRRKKKKKILKYSEKCWTVCNKAS